MPKTVRREEFTRGGYQWVRFILVNTDGKPLLSVEGLLEDEACVKDTFGAKTATS